MVGQRKRKLAERADSPRPHHACLTHTMHQEICDASQKASSSPLISDSTLAKPQPANLSNSPSEILGKIIGNLDVASLKELSHVSSIFHKLLSNTDGNILWYEAIPPPLFGSVSIHQVGSAPWNQTYVQPARVDLLGAAYNSKIDYKKEIWAYWKYKNNCNVCFEGREQWGKHVDTVAWGKMWCSSCLSKYSVDLGELGPKYHKMVLSLELPFYTDLMGDELYYRPDVDRFLLPHTGLTCAEILQASDTAAISGSRKRMMQSEAESIRRRLRLQIVEAAKKEWEDPVVMSDANTEGATSAPIPLFTRKSKRGVAFLRNTYAPTSKLGEFLFPPWLLAEDPTLAPAMPKFEWLDDPTAYLKVYQLNELIDNEIWVVTEARCMLHMLTYFLHSLYPASFRGRIATTFLNAATEWNVARIKSELADGSVLRLEHVTDEMKNRSDPHGGMHRGLKELRKQLGLPAEPSVDKKHGALTRQEALANRFFQKIMLGACTRCPQTCYYVFPGGLDNILKHMRSCHPTFFWLGDFHILG